MTLAIGADHAGFALKRVLKDELAGKGYAVLDMGTDDDTSADYPDFAEAVVGEILAGRAQMGVLVCGTGIGMSIAANRHEGIRAALCHDENSARLARQHNDANVFVVAGRGTDGEDAKKWLDVFLSTDFEGGRHSRRVTKLK